MCITQRIKLNDYDKFQLFIANTLMDIPLQDNFHISINQALKTSTSATSTRRGNGPTFTTSDSILRNTRGHSDFPKDFNFSQQ